MNSTSLYDLSYTYHYSKYSCSRAFYFIHIVFCYLIFLFGVFAFVTRLHPKIKFLHRWCGIIYIISMLFCTASSLLIHNTGLPLAVLISFAYVLVFMTIAWFLIKAHQLKYYNLAVEAVGEEIKEGKYATNKDFNLKDQINTKTTEILGNRTLVQKMFSLKSFHGILMFTSWLNIAGRIFASNQSGDFTCYTYPVFKPVNSTYGPVCSSVGCSDEHVCSMECTGDILDPNCIDCQESYVDSGMHWHDHEPELVPEIDPNYDRLPWANNELGWALYLSLGPIVFGILVSVIWSTIDYFCGGKKTLAAESIDIEQEPVVVKRPEPNTIQVPESKDQEPAIIDIPESKKEKSDKLK